MLVFEKLSVVFEQLFLTVHILYQVEGLSRIETNFHPDGPQDVSFVTNDRNATNNTLTQKLVQFIADRRTAAGGTGSTELYHSRRGWEGLNRVKPG